MQQGSIRASTGTPATMSASDLEPLPASLGVTSVVLKRYVDAGPVPDDAFGVDNTTLDAAALPEGGVLAELLYLSVDPYMRPLMRENKAHYAPSFTLGQPLAGGAVALVRVSKAEGFSPGDVIVGHAPWSTFVALGPGELGAFNAVPKGLLGKVPLSYFLGTLGMPGLTAYSSLKKIAEPKAGETAYISAASGAVGQVAGQLLKRVYGCRVVGSAGSDDKVALLRNLGFDAAWNHREVAPGEGLAAHCPDGVDIYFENVGGETLDAVLEHANLHCRIVACGMISQYDLTPEQRYGVKNLFQIVAKQIKLQGFIVSTLAKGIEGEFAADMARWVAEGKIKVVEHVTPGIEAAPAAFRAMMAGGNLGKAVVRVAERDPFPAATAAKA
ncbi:MAG: NADPH dependent alkenal/alkenone reductase [Monoraphidium minutum]|nr:MAG: NADPH dependent alkenal/alkenone reductase [Monoraphidium minutum]